MPQFQFIDRVVDSSVVLQRRIPTVQTVQKTGVILQVQFLDKVDDARCCTTTGAWVITVQKTVKVSTDAVLGHCGISLSWR